MTKLKGTKKVNYEVTIETNKDHVTATLIIDFNGTRLEQYLYSSSWKNSKGGTLEANLKYIYQEVLEQWGETIKQ
jgi:hypothetical protein